ncbi:MAG: hypothetical protein WEB57_06720 [Pseudohongiellaceae bacterium]
MSAGSRRLNRLPPIVLLLVLGLVSGSLSVHAQDSGDSRQGPDGIDNEEMPWFREVPGREKYLLIINGPGATPAARQRFAEWSADLHDLFPALGYRENSITLLFDEGKTDAAPGERVDGSTRREDVASFMEDLATRAAPGDQLTVILIGHGSSRFGEARINNAGPDVTASEFADMLEPFEGVDIAVINTTSASYPFSEALSAPGRVIISATRSPAERYDTMFSGFLVEALEERNADLDRNGRLSLLEVFNHTRRSVEGWYEEQGRLATEHAVLDDSGDGNFVAEPEPLQGDGLLAEVAYLDSPQMAREQLSPQAQELRARMQELERSVVLLRGRKNDYLESEYWQRMESLLVELAQTTRRFHELP